MKKNELRILVLSNTPWNNNNSFGNSFSNIFEGIPNLIFANIFCRDGFPQNNIASKYFQINEKLLLKNLINKNIPSGIELTYKKLHYDYSPTEDKLFKYAQKKRLQLFFWGRDLIWKIGKWKSEELKNFILNFDPDILFQPLYYSNYINPIALYIKKLTNAPMVGYVSDDIFTLRQFSLSPLFWIDRFIKRRKIKKVINQCEYLYVISDIQKQEYEKIFKKECKILTKGAHFNTPSFRENNTPLRLVYTGNIGGGRWKTLAAIGEILAKINKNNIKAQLYIYSMTPLSKSMLKALSIKNTIFFMGPIPSFQIPEIQKNADVLVHVEPTDLKGGLQVRHSFSTKIVDYFYAARCILAVGWKNAASIDYLLKKDAAIVAFDKQTLFNQLKRMTESPELLKEYAWKAWKCGEQNHQIDIIQNNLLKDLRKISKQKS